MLEDITCLDAEKLAHIDGGSLVSGGLGGALAAAAGAQH